MNLPQRELKFRVWDKKKRKMAHVVMIDLSMNRCLVTDMKDLWEIKDPDIMQYTGLKDKNGREIYDGDIIVSGSGNIYVVMVTRYGSGYGFDIKKIGFDKKSQNWNDEIKIMGNIYENPELLNKIDEEK